MEDILNYYYNELSKKTKMNYTSEDLNKSVPIIQEYIDRYGFYLKKGVLHPNNKCYIIPLLLNDACYGIIRIDNNNIRVGINKDLSPIKFVITEHLIVKGDKFTGNYVDFVLNESKVKMVVEDKEDRPGGSIVVTKFGNRGIINALDGKIYDYDVNADSDKVLYAYELHQVTLEEQYNRFMCFDNMNIRSVKIHKPR